MKKHINFRDLISVLSTLCLFSSVAFADKPDQRVSESRYTSVALGAEISQTNLLEGIVEISIPAEIDTVGQSLEYLIAPHGFAIGEPQEAKEQYLLFALPLPESHRHLGPMSLREAIHILGGESFEPVINPVMRSLTFALKEEFIPFVIAEELENAKASWDASNQKSLEVPDTCDKEANERSYGPVQAGESLSSIVNQFRFEGLTRSQSLVLSFQANPHAFDGDNMNHLMQGVTLNIPEVGDGFAVSPIEANRIVVEHFRLWTALVAQEGE